MSRKETKYPSHCPKEITKEIREFANEITGQDNIYHVPIVAMPLARFGQCYQNCSAFTEAVNGQMVLGWMIWQTKNLYLTAEHHCIVRLDSGKYFDPTPDTLSHSSQVLFCPSGQDATYESIEQQVKYGNSVHHKLLKSHPLLESAMTTLTAASNRRGLAINRALENGHVPSPIIYRDWEFALDRLEMLLSRYERQTYERTFGRDQRKKAKMKRKARKAARV